MFFFLISLQHLKLYLVTNKSMNQNLKTKSYIFWYVFYIFLVQSKFFIAKEENFAY